MEKNLLKVSKISVREDAGTKIVMKLTGRKAIRHIDPTLLLDKNEWLKILEKPKKSLKSDKYLLIYFLGEISEEYYIYIKNYANKNNLDIININSVSDVSSDIVSPSEFVYLIKNASFVATDSFHGTVFSVIMHVQFIVFERIGLENSMESRIDTLLNMLDLEERKFQIIKHSGNNDEIDFQNVDIIINKERMRSLAYFNENLKSN